MIEEAILVMDSRTDSGSVRSQSLAPGWTRLYKSEHHFLDLWLQHSSIGATLTGMVFQSDLDHGVVGSVAIQDQPSVALDREGGFRIGLQPGLHDPYLHLSDTIITVRDIEA